MYNATNRRISFLLAILGAAGLCVGCGRGGQSEALESVAAAERPIGVSDEDEVPWKTVKLLIEHNATQQDTGFQGFLDGEPWKKLEIRNPSGTLVLSISAQGRLRGVGLTELFFETNEPPNAEVPIPEQLANMPAGNYEFEGQSVEGPEQTGVARLSHKIPAGPVITAPPPDAVVSAEQDLIISWNHVTRALYGGNNVNITHYQLIVNKLGQVPGRGFGAETYSVHVPASIRSMKVPSEFLLPGTSYEFEVMAIEANGNQTFSEGAFRTP